METEKFYRTVLDEDSLRELLPERAFQTVWIGAGQSRVIHVQPPRSSYFQPRRFRISVFDPREPTGEKDLRIGAITVGGSPQLDINNKDPGTSSMAVHPRDLNDQEVDWSAFSVSGFARELQIFAHNPNHDGVFVFITVDGEGMSYIDHDEKRSRTSGRPDEGSDRAEPREPLRLISSDEVELKPGETRCLMLLPSSAAYWHPYELRCYAHRTSDNAEVPFSMLDAFCGKYLLLGTTPLRELFDHAPIAQTHASDETARELLRKLGDKLNVLERYGPQGLRVAEGMKEPRFESDPRGLLSRMIESDGGFIDISDWPICSAAGLGQERGSGSQPMALQHPRKRDLARHPRPPLISAIKKGARGYARAPFQMVAGVGFEPTMLDYEPSALPGLATLLCY